MTTTTQALQAARDLLADMPIPDGYYSASSEVIDKLDAALAQPQTSAPSVEQAAVTECEACFTPDVCQLRGTCDHYAAEQLRVAKQADALTKFGDWTMLPHNATEPMQKAMQRAVMLRKSMNDVWRAAINEAPNSPVTAPAGEPNWHEVREQAEAATGLKVERHTFSIVIREVRKWLAGAAPLMANGLTPPAGCKTPDGCRENGCLGWCDDHAPQAATVSATGLASIRQGWDVDDLVGTSPQAAPVSALSKAQRVHAMVNAGPFPGMSEAFNAQMGAECWTDPAYAPDASTWSAAWKAAWKAARASAPAVAAPTAQPDGRLHDDGCFTWARRDGYVMDERLPCDFYLAAPAVKESSTVAARPSAAPLPAREPLSEKQVQHLIDTKHFDPYYGLKASDRVCIDWYRIGLRDGEEAHGITAAPAAKGEAL